MNIQSSQVQLKVSLSEQLKDRLESKAARLGIPVTQFVKHLILKEVEIEEYPVFEASDRTIKKAKQALKEKNKAIVVKDIQKYFKNL